MLNAKLCSLKSMTNLYLRYSYRGQKFVNMKELCATLFMQLLMEIYTSRTRTYYKKADFDDFCISVVEYIAFLGQVLNLLLR